MTPNNVFRLQLAAAASSKRRVLLRVGLTALLALPFILVGMPLRAQAAGIVMVILFTSFFGAAVGHARLRDDGRLERLMLLPIHRAVLWLDLVLASVAARLIPTGVVLAAFLIVNAQQVYVGLLITTAGFLCASLLLLTVLGIATARLARTNAEVHLFGALAVGFVALLSGIMPLPERLAGVDAVAEWSPVQHLFSGLLAASHRSEPMQGPAPAVALLMFGAVATAMAIRWVSGRVRKAAMFDHAEGAVHNEAAARGWIR